jgi:hypothetical protein
MGKILSPWDVVRILIRRGIKGEEVRRISNPFG